VGYVAATTGLFALGAYLGRNLHGGFVFIAYLAAFAALIAMQFSVRRSRQRTVALLAAFGLLMGVAVAPERLPVLPADLARRQPLTPPPGAAPP
jgi:modulator of FtsH protease